jgi:hypothetical protein
LEVSDLQFTVTALDFRGCKPKPVAAMTRKVRWLPALMAEYLGWQFFPAWMHLHSTQETPKPQADDDELASYHNDALRGIINLLYLHPGRDHIAEDYPGLGDAIKHLHSQKSSPQRTALFVARSILVDFIGKLSADQRASIVRELREVTQGQLADILRDPKSQENVMLGTITIGYSLNAAAMLVEKQQVERSQVDSFRSDILAALGE